MADWKKDASGEREKRKAIERKAKEKEKREKQLAKNREWKKGLAEKQRSKPKKTYDLKRTAIKKQSTRKSSINNQYSKTIRQKSETMEYVYCEGCGRSDLKCNNSHSIPESWNDNLKNELENISYHCQEAVEGKIYSCHKLCELGRWDMLQNGEQIKEYVLKTDPEYYAKKYKDGTIKNSK